MNSGKPMAVLDTDVVSYMIKGLAIGAEYLALLRGYKLSMAFVTAAELQFGAERGGWGTRRRLRMDMFLQDLLVLPYADGMEHLYAKVMAERQRAGRRLEKADGWIATTAIYYDLPLAVHDGDFLGTPGLRIITVSPEVRVAQMKWPVAHGRPLNLNASCRCGV